MHFQEANIIEQLTTVTEASCKCTVPITKSGLPVSGTRSNSTSQISFFLPICCISQSTPEMMLLAIIQIGVS